MGTRWPNSSSGGLATRGLLELHEGSVGVWQLRHYKYMLRRNTPDFRLVTREKTLHFTLNSHIFRYLFIPLWLCGREVCGCIGIGVLTDLHIVIKR